MIRKDNERRRARLWPRLAAAAAATTAIGLAGFVGSASAHHANLSVNTTCQSDGSWNATVTIQYPDEGWSSGAGAFTWSISQGGSAIGHGVLSPGGSDSAVGSNVGNGTATVAFSASGTWANQVTWSDSITANRPRDCEVPETTPSTPETTTPTTPETTPTTPSTPETTTPETTPTTPSTPETTTPETTACLTELANAECSPTIVEIMQPATVDPSTTDVSPATGGSVSPASGSATAAVPADVTLPETGAAATGVQLAAGLAAVGAGTALVVVARRRREASPDA